MYLIAPSIQPAQFEFQNALFFLHCGGHFSRLTFGLSPLLSNPLHRRRCDRGVRKPRCSTAALGALLLVINLPFVALGLRWTALCQVRDGMTISDCGAGRDVT
jgi:hypothetical protein